MKRWNRSILGWSLVLSMVAAGGACGSSGDPEKDDHPEGKQDAGPSKEPVDDNGGKQPEDAGKGGSTGSSNKDSGTAAGRDGSVGGELDASRGASAPADAGVTGPSVSSATRDTEDGGATDRDPGSDADPGTGMSAGAPTCDTKRCDEALEVAKKDPVVGAFAAQATVCCIDANTCGGTFPGAGKCFSDKEILDGLMMLPAGPQIP